MIESNYIPVLNLLSITVSTISPSLSNCFILESVISITGINNVAHIDEIATIIINTYTVLLSNLPKLFLYFTLCISAFKLSIVISS